MRPTIVVAAIGWFFGMLQLTFFGGNENVTGSTEQSTPVVLAIASFFGVAAGAVFGYAEWLRLRRQVNKAWIRIPTDALGWTTAIVIIFAGAKLPDENRALWQVIPVGMLTGILVGRAIGVTTGFGLIRVLRHKAGLQTVRNANNCCVELCECCANTTSFSLD